MIKLIHLLLLVFDMSTLSQITYKAVKNKDKSKNKWYYILLAINIIITVFSAKYVLDDYLLPEDDEEELVEE